MHRPRPIHSLLSLLVALGLVLTPAMTRSASAAKPAAAAPKKKSASQTKASRSAAAKKGWETRRMGDKASANWAARTAANPKLKNNKKAEATFKARSMASQKSAARRSKSSTTAMKPAKQAKSGRKVKRNKAIAKKSGKKNKQSKKNKKNNGAVAEEEIDDEDGIDAEDDDDFSDVIENAGFDEATMAEAGDAFAEAEEHMAAGRTADAVDAAIYGHELMAYEAELAAQDYDADGEHDQADSIRLFASKHTEAANALRTRFPTAEEGQAADEGDDEAEVDDEVEEPRAERATGFFGKMKANRAARASFKQMVREDGGMRGEYNRLKSEKRSWKTGFFTGLSAVAFVKNMLPIVLTGVVTTGGAIFAGLGAVGLASAGIREYKLRDASRKELVKDLYASGELEPHEIQTYQAAGWL